MSKPKLLFVATEDWFVASHFLALLRRARKDGFEVVVAARASGALNAISDVRVVDTGASRGALQPLDVLRQVTQLRSIIARERPAIIHAIALKPIALSLLAGARCSLRVFAVTGRGYLAANGGRVARVLNNCLRMMLRRALDGPDVFLLVENEWDRHWVEGKRALPSDRVAVMPGAGIDPDAFPVIPEPSGPFTVGIVTRLIRSKGVDVAVEAVRRLRAAGYEIALRVAGDIDRDNPDAVSDRELTQWRSTAGVELVGRVRDVSAFWRTAHVACLPSRGGEGLPRSLLEAAVCNRPIVTSDVPGCADFVVEGRCGLIRPAGDAEALADALLTLKCDIDSRRRMGAAARARVCERYTEEHAADCAARAWRKLKSSDEQARGVVLTLENYAAREQRLQ